MQFEYLGILLRYPEGFSALLNLLADSTALLPSSFSDSLPCRQ